MAVTRVWLPERLLGVRDVAQMLGVSAASVYGLCSRGLLRHVRVGNMVRVSRADLVHLKSEIEGAQ